jgi:serine phosphatase RsbU (regulator of sigma subunit)/CHASE3 domain sensor protein
VREVTRSAPGLPDPGEASGYRQGVSLRQRALGLLLVAGVILAWAALVVERAFDDVSAQRAYVAGTVQRGQDLSLDTLVEALNQETGARGFVLTGDAAFLDPYVSGREAVREDLTALTALFAAEPETLGLIEQVERDFAAWSDRSRAEVRAAREGDVRRARQLIRQGEGKAAFDQLRASAGALQEHIRDELVRQRALTESAFDQLRTTFWAVTAVLVALVLVAGLLLRRWVLVPVDQLRSSMRAVAAGDLGSPVVAPGPEEVEAIGLDAEAMRRRIVAELENTRAAAEALEQDSPAVAGLMRELQSTSTEQVRGVEVRGVVRPAEGVLAGDWWDALPLPGGRTAVVVADVSGHGPEACLVAARFKQRLTVLLQADIALPEAFEVAVRDLDLEDERFLSCVVVLLNPDWRRVQWLNAGHPGALLLRRAADDLTGYPLDTTGPIVGAPGARWSVEETWLGVDDMLLLVTDGITEARDASDRELGVDGVVDSLRHSRARTPERVVEEVVDTVRRFAVDLRRDDLTCVALRLSAPVDDHVRR